MKVYFSHGKESGPWGSKIKSLANIAKAQGLEVDSIDYSDTFDPDRRANRLIEILKNADDEFLLVGSSMGGYVALVAAEQVKPKGVFLLAPALFIPGYKQQVYNPQTAVQVVHGWADDVIPPENSLKFARQADCSLHLIPGDHRLNSSLDTVCTLFSQFIRSHLSNG